MMRRRLAALALAAGLAVSVPIPAGAFSLGHAIRDAGASCAYGAGLLAATTWFGLTPIFIGTGVLAVPGASAVAQNAVVGCAIGAAGVSAAHVFTWVYDSLFW